MNAKLCKVRLRGKHAVDPLLLPVQVLNITQGEIGECQLSKD
jgi:hypothetical protein